MLGSVEAERGCFLSAGGAAVEGVGAVADKSIPTFGADATVETGLRRTLLRLSVTQGANGS